MEVLKVALTGGPCGGKTTSISTIEQSFKEKGYHVIVVPEAATILINSGIRPFGDNSLSLFEFQKLVMGLQFHLEETASLTAKQLDVPTIILCDRGLLDDKAYVSDDEFKQLINEFNTTQFDLLNRYDLVMHLKSLADGKMEMYEELRKNNSARSEDGEEALAKDKKTLESWLGHDNIKYFGNDTDFDAKIDGTIREIHKMLNTPYPTQKQEKYLVESFDIKALQRKHPVVIEIEQYVELTEFGEIIYRKSKKDGEIKYTRITKTDTPDESERIVTRKNISEDEYLRSIPTEKIPLRKSRYCFEYENQYFRLDIFDDGLQLLEIEETNRTRKRAIPGFITIADEVTSSPLYRNSTLFIEKNSGEKVKEKK